MSHFISFSLRVLDAPWHVICEHDYTWICVHFLADKEIFSQVNFQYDVLAKRLRELSFLNNGVRIRLVDERQGKEENFAFLGGVKGFVEYIKRPKTVLHENIFSVSMPSADRKSVA